MDPEVQSTIINLYEKMGDASLSRDFLTEESYTVELLEIENSLKAGKSIFLGKCPCDHMAEPNLSHNNAKESNHINCYLCMKKYMSHEKASKAEKVDYLGWGLTGLFEQQSSDDSDGSTSTEDGHCLERRVSEARHKILRKIRRSKPEAFELNYLEFKFDNLTPDAEGADLQVTERRQKSDYNQVKPVVISKREQSKNSFLKDYNTYGKSKFDFANEIELREKYSSTKFDILTGLVHYYQKYLCKHPEEHYPNVSELLIQSGQTICKAEDDIVSRYYDVLRKKGGQKKVLKLVSKNSIGESKISIKSPETTRIDNYNYLVPREERLKVRKSGVLDLSNRCIVNVPEGVWTTDKELNEKPTTHRIFSNLPPNKTVHKPKPLSYLNLGHNKIHKFEPKGTVFNSLVHLSLTSNSIDHLTNDFGNFKNLEILDLENNLLTLLPETFCNIISLKELNLRRNCLIELPQAFGNLKKLETIDVRWNYLKALPDTFEDLESLGNLTVAFNKLKMLPLDLSNLYNLIILDVSYNKLVRLPALTYMPKLLLVNAMGNLIKDFPNFRNSTSLCEIRLDGNRIKHIITDHLLNCPVVQLTLSHNKIVQIPDDLYNVPTLVLLDCTNNRLTILPWSMARLKYLTCLRVEENHIENIDTNTIKSGSKSILEALLQNLLSYEGEDDVILKAKKEVEVLYTKGKGPSVSPLLKNLKLDPKNVSKTHSIIKKRLELTELPSEWVQLGQLYKVTTVDLSKNKFRYIPAGLKTLRATLKELTLRENIIRTVPDFIGRMPQLISLDLTFNCLDTLPLSMTTCQLSKLVCKKNFFSAIPKVVYMILTLEHLDFSENMIKEIDVDGLRNLRKLNHLNLRKNEIKILPGSLGYLMNIRKLDITDNLIRRPGPNIIRGGTQVILDYLKKHPEM